MRSFSFTVSSSLFTEQYLALALISTNFSTSKISDGMCSPHFGCCDGYKSKFLSVLVYVQMSNGLNRELFRLCIEAWKCE